MRAVSVPVHLFLHVFDDRISWLLLFFVSKRYRIGPFEVESALIEHTAVAESAVVSSPDSVRGSVSHK